MTVTPTYVDDLARVRIAADSMGVVLRALVERSTDQVRWSTVRGGAAYPVGGGAFAAPLDDYEFTPGVVNYYRVTYPAAPTVGTAATASHADYASITPALPAGLVAGQSILCFTAIHTPGATVNTVSAGWTLIVELGNVRVWRRTATGGGTDVAPVLTVAGGAAGASVSAQCVAVTGTFVETTVVYQSNASAQNVAYPAIPGRKAGDLVMWFGWKSDDWTGVVSPGTEIGEPSTTLGSDQGLVWSYQVRTTDGDVPAGSFTVTGGGAATSTGFAMAFTPANTSQVGSVTPIMTDVWLKSIVRPFLNLRCKRILPSSTAQYSARNGYFSIIGRRNPVVVTDVRQSRAQSFQIVTETAGDGDRLEFLLASGDLVYLHAPANAPVKSMYGAVGTVSETPVIGSQTWRQFDLPIQAIAAPSEFVVGATATCATVLATYTTCAALLAAHATCADVLTLIGDPSEVVVP